MEPEPYQDPDVVEIIKRLLRHLTDEDLPDLADTPKRVARFYYQFFRPPTFKFTLFEANGMSELITERGISFFSLCQHHLLPFFGTVTIGYLPRGKIVGLSKLPALVNRFASRLQTQEYMTQQLGEYLTNHQELRPLGVGVSINAIHTCMVMRGVKAVGSSTRTQFLSGILKSDPAARAEFLGSVEHRSIL